jgi:hypothetical protein
MSTIPKPALVKLASEQLLKVLDEDLQGMIRSTRCVYARQLKIAWDVKNWDRKSSKTSRTKQLADVLDFHECRMIHGR